MRVALGVPVVMRGVCNDKNDDTQLDTMSTSVSVMQWRE